MKFKDLNWEGAALVAAMVFVMTLATLAMWKVSRYANYSFSYEAMVRQTVRDLVKPEALK